LVGGDSLVLERTDFSARIAFVDYDGQRAMKNYADNPPKTSLDRIEFVKDNAPKIVDGIAMIKRYLDDIKSKTNSKLTKRGMGIEKVTTP
jgi:aspartate aminotransferase